MYVCICSCLCLHVCVLLCCVLCFVRCLMCVSCTCSVCVFPVVIVKGTGWIAWRLKPCTCPRSSMGSSGRPSASCPSLPWRLPPRAGKKASPTPLHPPQYLLAPQLSAPPLLSRELPPSLPRHSQSHHLPLFGPLSVNTLVQHTHSLAILRGLHSRKHACEGPVALCDGQTIPTRLVLTGASSPPFQLQRFSINRALQFLLY